MSAVIRPCVLEWAQRRGGRDDDDMRGRFANWDRWLTEEERPGFSEVEAIANFTHVPVGYLFLSEGPMSHRVAISWRRFISISVGKGGTRTI